MSTTQLNNLNSEQPKEKIELRSTMNNGEEGEIYRAPKK